MFGSLPLAKDKPPVVFGNDAANEKLLPPYTDDEKYRELEHRLDEEISTRTVIRRLRWAIFVLVAICSLLCFILAWAIPQLLAAKESLLFSPVNRAIEWETVVFHNNFHEDRTPYQGPPTDEVDRAWEDLYRDIGIVAIDADDAKQLPNATFPLPDDPSRYVVGIEVFHQLHCLNSIRRALYPERYRERENLTTTQALTYQIHLEHCVDSIRQTVMCYSDVSTIPWVMNPYHNRPAPDAHTTHVCRNFDKIQEWARERAYTQEEYDIALVSHPYGVTVT